MGETALPFCSSREPHQQRDRVPLWFLHRCEEDGCHGLLRPHVVWFGETLDPDILTEVEKELDLCDLCLVVSEVLWPSRYRAGGTHWRGCTSWVKEMQLYFPTGTKCP